MQYQEFVNRVDERIEHMPSVDAGETEYAIQATLTALGEHLGGARAEELCTRLPAELEAQLARGSYFETARGFTAEEFHLRVAELGGPPLAEEDGGGRERAVLAVLSEAVGDPELAELPSRPSWEGGSLPNAGDLPR